MPHYVKAIEDVGKKFGRLTVIGVGRPGKSRARQLICKCECGVTKHIEAPGIRQGRVVSCGCYRLERVRAAITTHGQSYNITFKSYRAMLGRCYDPSNGSYEAYTQRGIAVCDRWRGSFDAFLSDMGERPSKDHSIDRIDNQGNYEPGNCRWATRSEQAANRTVAKTLTAFGLTLPLAEWARRSGLPYPTIRQRLIAGQTPEQAVSTPGRKHGIEVRTT